MWIHVVFCMITKIFMYFNVKINGCFVEISMNICHTIINTFKGDKFLYRKIMRFLESWKESKYRKPLILQGARQVGKTYSILEFGRTYYENVAYFNFETNPKLNETFEENISPDYLIPILSHIAGQTIVREKTLIVFDEVQLCERALTSLKYFCEDAPGYHIIAAGSLLFVAAGRARFSFPVGKADMKILYPMDMEEFMLAMGEGSLVEQIKNVLLPTYRCRLPFIMRQWGSTASISSWAVWRKTMSMCSFRLTDILPIIGSPTVEQKLILLFSGKGS